MAFTKSENQNQEFKESWRDDHLKTICALANVSGGKFYIGIDDNGALTGVKDSAKLMEDIPSKIKELLGLIPSVNLKKEKKKEYIEIKIKASEVAVSFKGKFYLRSGSTTQELNGPELQRFLLSKSNTTWDEIPEENATIDEIDKPTVESFRVKAKEKKLPAANEKNVEQLLDKLHLRVKGKLNRAGVLLFTKDPQLHYPSAFTKIARFSKDDVLQSSDEVKGTLFQQAELTMEILKNKYLSSDIEINGLYRNEKLEYPESALREAIVNALAHKEYSGPPIQISVYPDKLIFWNAGKLPTDLTIESLKKRHASHPRNQKIANVFYSSGLIEAWGSGTMKMTKECVKAGLPEPVFEVTDGGIQVTFSKDLYSDNFLLKQGLNEGQIKIIQYLKEFGVVNNAKVMDLVSSSKRTATRNLSELLSKKIIEKSGSTGKGTSYSLIGQNVTSNITNSSPRNENRLLSELDDKLQLLDKELEYFDPEDEIKKQFSKELYVEIFDTWFSELVLEVIPIIQKFNRYFINPVHYIHLPNNIAYGTVTDEKPAEVLRLMKDQVLTNIERIQNYELNSSISTSYGTFRKAGLDTFGANYSIDIKFSPNWYEIITHTEVLSKERVTRFKRQYHKPVTSAEIQDLAKDFGELIYQHINQMINQIKEKKGNGATKGPKGPLKK